MRFNKQTSRQQVVTNENTVVSREREREQTEIANSIEIQMESRIVQVNPTKVLLELVSESETATGEPSTLKRSAEDAAKNPEVSHFVLSFFKLLLPR